MTLSCIMARSRDAWCPSLKHPTDRFVGLFYFSSSKSLTAHPACVMHTSSHGKGWFGVAILQSKCWGWPNKEPLSQTHACCSIASFTAGWVLAGGRGSSFHVVTRAPKQKSTEHLNKPYCMHPFPSHIYYHSDQTGEETTSYKTGFLCGCQKRLWLNGKRVVMTGIINARSTWKWNSVEMTTFGRPW